jgi:site-specific recombinase XerC
MMSGTDKDNSRLRGFTPPSAQPSRRASSQYAAHEGVAHLSAHQNLRAVQLLLGHSKLEGTVRYVGIEVAHSAGWE